DPLKIATKTIGGLFDGATTKELDTLSIQTSAQFIAEETEYSKLAARLLATFIDKEVANQDIHSFSQSIGAGLRAGLIADRTAAFVSANPSSTLGGVKFRKIRRLRLKVGTTFCPTRVGGAARGE
ncbi:MAG: ribonucleoside-diphosphate reductase alpha chain, partial [Actinomycetota bacterium]|nr:ribonucleoside-diphosphate reductase alpha chain [Actinomycetota bacterium]